MFLDASKTVLFFGLESSEFAMKISILMTISDDRKVLDVVSFSTYVTDLSQSLLQFLLQENSRIRVGKYGIKTLNQKHIITLNNSFVCENSRFHPASLKSALQMLLSSYSSLSTYIKDNKAPTNEILVNEFIKLLQEPKS